MKHKITYLITVVASAGAILNMAPAASAAGNHLSSDREDWNDSRKACCSCMDRSARQGLGAEDLTRKECCSPEHQAKMEMSRKEREERAEYRAERREEKQNERLAKSNETRANEMRSNEMRSNETRANEMRSDLRANETRAEMHRSDMPSDTSRNEWSNGVYRDSYARYPIDRSPRQGLGGEDLTQGLTFEAARESGDREISEPAGSERRLRKNWRDSNQDGQYRRE